MNNRFGAFPEDWDLLDLGLGLTADLLPCVSNPNKEIADNSKLKALGKVPSVFNRDGKIVGLANWTEKRSTSKDINLWRKESDYGICLQTRLVRALDIDVPDRAQANKIAEELQRCFGGRYPTRSRADSGKFLVAFRLPGEFAKRKLAVDGGIIEFLAGGQQFVACGTHPSGARYEFEWFGHSDFPALEAGRFEEIWLEIANKFGIAPPVAGGLRKPKGAALGYDPDKVDIRQFDQVAAHLLDINAVIGTGNDGQLYLECPWKDEHTSDSGETQTAYFPAGTRGYALGHFNCLHSHCAGRADEEFKSAFGCGLADDFEILPEEPEANPARTDSSLPALPAFSRKKDGAITATINNLTAALSIPAICKWHIGFDEFRDEIMYHPESEPGKWRALGDADYVRIREYLESNGFDPIGRELVRDAVLRVADDRRFDSAQTWLRDLTHDGVARVDLFLNRYFGVPVNAYTRGVSLYIWTGLAGRILQPGVKTDMVPIFINGQGNLKSTAVGALAPSPEFFVTMKLDDRDDNLSRLMRGRLVVELPELSGLHTRELEAIKAFITRTHESWVPKFREFATSFPRRCLFFGTTNRQELFVDDTGNRRWLPIEAQKADVEAIIADREQLYAEGRQLFLTHGVMWQDAERLAPTVHERHMMIDTWMEAIDSWLHATDDISEKDSPATRGQITVLEVLQSALNLEIKSINKSAEMRVTTCLRKLGWERSLKRVNGKPMKVWTPKSDNVTTLC